ncbi:MAG TPA: hypothetical protein VMT89_06440 [Candidatus Acidoferrales bacterium]|nr:hypothetical protein [Candidatus Acidoferrales bacterium]
MKACKIILGTLLVAGMNAGQALAGHNLPKSTATMVMPLIRAYPDCTTPDTCLLTGLAGPLTCSTPTLNPGDTNFSYDGGTLMGYCANSPITACNSATDCSGNQCLRLRFGPNGNGKLTIAGKGTGVKIVVTLTDVRAVDDTGTDVTNLDGLHLSSTTQIALTTDHCASDTPPGGTCQILNSPACPGSASNQCCITSDSVFCQLPTRKCTTTCNDPNAVYDSCTCAHSTTPCTTQDVNPFSPPFPFSTPSFTCTYKAKAHRTDCSSSTTLNGTISGDAVAIDSVVIQDPAGNPFLRPGIRLP